MDAPEKPGRGTTESAANEPDLSDLFAAEDSPMLGGLAFRAAAVGGLVVLVLWLLRRRRT